jgi:NADPH-dependent 2,4-dienoyl-CoA reductase/sulfur reductase-like enzyme
VGARLFPGELSRFVTDYYREKGVELHTGELASQELVDGADVVVAGLGIVPNTKLAEDAGLPVEDGIVVDDRGRVGGRDDVFAAGDVARFPVSALGKAMRVEHEDHANTHGRVVGANMAGADTPYDHLPFFYSDLFDLGYEAVGEVDSRLATVEHWKHPGREGVVAYVDGDGKPRGFLLWNVWGKVDDARELITAGQPIDAAKVEELAG